MADTTDHETGEIVPRPPQLPTPYQSSETGQLADALARAQGIMESPKRTKTGKIEGVGKTGNRYAFEYTYAPFEEVVRVMQQPFSSNGLAWHQGLITRGGEFFIRTLIRHAVSGEWIASDYPVIADKTGAQGFAAGTTYAKRYGLSLAAGLAAEDDDDGRAAQTGAPETRAQARPANTILKAAVEARLNGEATQQAPQAAAAANGSEGPAKLMFKRLCDEIDQAQTIAELNATGIYKREPLAEIAPGEWVTAAEEAQRLMHVDPGAAKAGAWQKLVDRDARRRLELAEKETFNG